MNAQTKIEAPDNLRIWNALGKTDPAHTKQFQRAGGFRGTALKPIWVEKRLTELFGPCGIGWGTEAPEFRTMEAAGETLVYATVRGWYVENGVRGEVYGVGGDKVVSITKNGPKADDEAFKKAATDAIGNAFKHVGVGADIHMGQFEDSKYVQAVAKEFAVADEEPPAKRRKLDGPYTSPTALSTACRQFVHTLEGLADINDYDAIMGEPETKEFLAQLQRDMPDWWQGGPSVAHLDNFEPLEIRLARKKRELDELETINNRQRVQTPLDAG